MLGQSAPLVAPGVDELATQQRLAFARADALNRNTKRRRSLLGGASDAGLVPSPLQQARTLG